MNYEGFFTQINEIPIISAPDVFGLHPNAEITYFANGAKQLWLDLLSMQSVDSGGGAEVNKEEYVYKIAENIQEKIPIPFDVLKLRKELGVEISPPTVVLL